MFQILKKATARAAQSQAFEKSVARLQNIDRQHQGLLRVVMYHRVDQPEARPWLDPALISATPEDFAEQMKYLASNYQIVNLRDVITALESGSSQALPPRAVLVTFDDGYCDFEEQAWPILKRYGIPAILFVPTAFPDQPGRTFWWDDLHQVMQNASQKTTLNTLIDSLDMSNGHGIQTFGQLRSYLKTLKHTEAKLKVQRLCRTLGVQPAPNSILGWDALRKLAGEGLTLGAHTRTHALLNRISFEAAREEVVGSLHDLERQMGSALPIFAYPSGQVSNEVISLLEREGFVLAFATKRGINHLNRIHPLRIGRLNIGPGTTLPILGARLLSWTTHLNWLQTLMSA